MKKNKRLQKIVELALKSCFEDAKLNEKKAQQFVEFFKKLPRSQAIFALNAFLKGLRVQMQKQTLVVESASALNTQQVKGIEKSIKGEFEILKTEVKLNPALLGGLKFRVGDYIFDDSVRERIEQLKGAING